MFLRFIDLHFGHSQLQVFLSFSVRVITLRVSFLVWLAQERVSWCISLRAIYLVGVSAFWQEYLQRFTLNCIFMMAGSIQNPSTFFCFLLFAMDCIVYSMHLRETGETG